MTISDRTVDVDGLPVHYLEAGEENGRALLLLHGGIGNASTNWREVMPSLAEEFHVFAPDLPGFGGSAALPVMSIDRLIDWLHKLLDTLGQSDTVIVGNFIGGLLARLFAASAPQYVPALILVNGGMIPELPVFLPVLVRMPLIGSAAFEIFGWLTRSRRSLERLIFVKDVLDENFLNAWHEGTPAFTQLVRAMITYLYPDDQQRPLVPTLLLWGSNDSMMTVAEAEKLQQNIPGATLSLIASCGSLPQLEASDAFVFQVRSFLDHISRPAAPTLHGVGMLRPNSA